MRTRLIRSRCALALVAVLAAACGEDGPDAEQPVERVLTIGLIAPLEAGLTDFGHDFQNGAQLAIDAANERNAVPGWTIRLRALDDSSDPATGKAAAETIAKDPTVVGVVGTYNSGVAREVAPVLDEAGILMLSPGNTDSALTLGDDPANPERQWDHYFRMVAADNVQGPFLARQAAEDLKFKRAAVISETKPVSKGLADEFAKEFAAAGGTVVIREVVPDETESFASVIAKVSPLAPDLLFFGGEYQVAASMKVQANAAGITVPVMGGDGIKDDAYIAGAGNASDGDYASTIGQPVATSESAAEFLEAFEAAGFDRPAGDFGPYAFDAANILIDAAAKVLGTDEETSEPVDITDAQRAELLAAVAATDATGASGRLAFDEFGDTQTKILTLYRVEQGEWVAKATEQIDTTP